MNNLFSINRAADLLERDRATLVRALRHVPPDGYERGQPRWRMPTIIDALAIKPQARRETGKFRDRYSLRSRVLDDMRRTFEEEVALIGAEPSLERRREMALQLAPLLEQYQAAYLEIGRSLTATSSPRCSTSCGLMPMTRRWGDGPSRRSVACI